MAFSQQLISGPGNTMFASRNSTPPGPGEYGYVEKPKAAKHYKFRYACPACTGRAFYADTKEKFTARVCANCGHEVMYDPNNWIVNE